MSRYRFKYLYNKFVATLILYLVLTHQQVLHSRTPLFADLSFIPDSLIIDQNFVILILDIFNYKYMIIFYIIK